MVTNLLKIFIFSAAVRFRVCRGAATRAAELYQRALCFPDPRLGPRRCTASGSCTDPLPGDSRLRDRARGGRRSDAIPVDRGRSPSEFPANVYRLRPKLIPIFTSARDLPNSSKSVGPLAVVSGLGGRGTRCSCVHKVGLIGVTCLNAPEDKGTGPRESRKAHRGELTGEWREEAGPAAASGSTTRSGDPDAGPSPFFPDPPPSQSGDVQTPNIPFSSPPKAFQSSKSVVVAVSVSASVALLALVALSGFFLYRRRIKAGSADTESSSAVKMERGGGFSLSQRRSFSTLGRWSRRTDARASESNGSPLSKAELWQEPGDPPPSPELQPLRRSSAPRRVAPSSRRPPPVRVGDDGSSDDDAFYTPNASGASLTSESPSSLFHSHGGASPVQLGGKRL
ncbi:uncharacterized protein A4U43_C08F13200 [Asparagus officinalis]|nr:uncharacterized protein A4U43_C08F13200 [Asparagus officinalis]